MLRIFSTNVAAMALLSAVMIVTPCRLAPAQDGLPGLKTGRSAPARTWRRPALSQRAAASDSNGLDIKRVASRVGKAVKSVMPAKEKPPRNRVHQPLPGDPASLEDPNVDESFYLSLARLQERSGNVESAQRLYTKHLEQDSRNLKGMLAYARFLDRQNRLDEAADMYKRAVRVHPRERPLTTTWVCATPVRAA